MRKWAAVLAIGLAGNGLALAQEADVEPYVQAFCGLRGVEGGAARIHLLSPGLAGEVMKALAENARLQAETPDEKPPLGDGVPYQGYPDAAPVCEPGAVARDGDAVVAEVKYSFPDAPDAGWTDRVVFIAGEGGVYVIDDIRYGAEGDDTLRQVLEAVFEF